jgi:hypothetical protein
VKIVQIPSKLWIGGYEFELRTVAVGDEVNATLDKADQLILKAEDGVMLSGPVHYAIWLSASLNMRRRLEIVLHEITHALNWLHDIKDVRKYVHVDEETLAERHGRAWAQFWLDNPRFERWMTYTLARIRSEQRTGSSPAADKPTDGKEKIVNPKTE